MDGEACRYDVGAVEFLHSYLSGQRSVERRSGAPPPVPWFDAHRERSHVYVRLSEGTLPYLERLRILREVLAPTADRGGYHEDDARQDHFKAVERDWLLTYETAYGHQIRVAFPPADEERAGALTSEAVRAMGCHVVAAQTSRGEPMWTDGPAAEMP